MSILNKGRHDRRNNDRRDKDGRENDSHDDGQSGAPQTGIGPSLLDQSLGRLALQRPSPGHNGGPGPISNLAAALRGAEDRERDHTRKVRSTKIVATLGPATDSQARLSSLFDAGVNVFRLNASHGSWEERHKRIAAVRAMAAERRAIAAILLDLQGPKIRLGKFEGGGCVLLAGSEFTITVEEVLGNAQRASTIYPDFAKDVKPGDRVLLADGTLELLAIDRDAVSVCCKVIVGGPISDKKGINLPGVELSTSSLTGKDVEDLDLGLATGVDMIALSFVRSVNDLLVLRRLLEERESTLPVIAKIEKPEAWQNLESILAVADGVMVARGDLGVEMALERVPFIQKQIIKQARERGRFVITATQMLESMIAHQTPTRAEVSDVANAILDGTDAVMLSAETSVGIDPARAVQTMAKVALETESWRGPQRELEPSDPGSPSNAQIIADAVFHAASNAGVAAIGLYSTTGLGARLISRMRPPVPIYAFTPHPEVARQLTVLYGVEPVLAPVFGSTDEKLAYMEGALLAEGHLKVNDNVVFVAGQPRGRVSGIDLIKLHRLEAQS